MDWIQTLSIIATVIGSAYYVHRDTREDMKSQSVRTDKLYEIWCETQKEIKQLYVELLKERK
jgi:prefoldin subunit 5